MARKARIDMAGLRYGRLVGIAFAHTNSGGKAQWLFACDCGRQTIADGGNVRSGRTTSCGCLHREISAERLTTHGRRSAKEHDATYRAWQEMNTICRNASSPRFRYFGALGVSVCPRWIGDFLSFVFDLGERPTDTMLKRINEAQDFTPDNCRWTPIRPRSIRAKVGHQRRSAADLPETTVVSRQVVQRPAKILGGLGPPYRTRGLTAHDR